MLKVSYLSRYRRLKMKHAKLGFIQIQQATAELIPRENSKKVGFQQLLAIYNVKTIIDYTRCE